MLSVLNDESRDKPEGNEESKCPLKRDDTLSEESIEEDIRKVEPEVCLLLFLFDYRTYKSEYRNNSDGSTCSESEILKVQERITGEQENKRYYERSDERYYRITVITLANIVIYHH